MNKSPHGFWNSLQNQRQAFDRFAQELNFKRLEDWYQITVEDIRRLGGGGLIKNHYRDSPMKALESIYPEHIWIPWRFSQVPNGFWYGHHNARRFFDWLGVQLGFKKENDWYNITKEQVCSFGGSRLLSKHGDSCIRALESIYPEKEWIPWKFKQVPKGYWEIKENRSKFVDWLAGRLDIKHIEDWNRISQQQIEKLAPVTLFRKFKMADLLTEAYPNHKWSSKFLHSKSFPLKASQRALGLRIKDLFPKCEILEDYWHEELRFSSGYKMQLDFFVPFYSLAFEYQGQQHYENVYAFGAQWYYQEKDNEKKLACQSKGIALIEVPYWWDFTMESLQATVHKIRPDIIAPGKGIPIPLKPPSKFKK